MSYARDSAVEISTKQMQLLIEDLTVRNSKNYSNNQMLVPEEGPLRAKQAPLHTMKRDFSLTNSKLY